MNIYFFQTFYEQKNLLCCVYFPPYEHCAMVCFPQYCTMVYFPPVLYHGNPDDSLTRSGLLCQGQ